MKKEYKKLFSLAILMATAFAGVTTAEAFTLKLENLSTQKSVLLDDAKDPTGINDGILAYTDFGPADTTLGGWTVNMTYGQSSPTLGTPFSPHISLISQNNSSSTKPISLKITLTDTFGPFAPTGFLTSAWGNLAANATAQLETRFNGVPMDILGPFSGVFSGSSSFQIHPTDKNIFELIALINHPAGALSSSVGLEMKPVPVPPSLMLLGSAVFGILGFRKRNRDNE